MSEGAAAQAEKVRENRLRRMAQRRGLALRKSRRRDTAALDYGGYWLINATTSKVGPLVAGGERGMSLDAAEAWLTSALRRQVGERGKGVRR